jgi:hypothetical protein
MAETEPRLDASRPTALRAGGFLLVALGAVLMGIGAIAPWVTVGIPNESDHSSFRGTELPDGRIVLACAVVALISVASSRLVRSHRTRYALAVAAAAAGLVTTLVTAAFIRNGTDRGAVLGAIGIPRELWARFGVFRDLGAGVSLALAGGLLCLTGAILTIWWVHRMPRDRRPGELSAEPASG